MVLVLDGSMEQLAHVWSGNSSEKMKKFIFETSIDVTDLTADFISTRAPRVLATIYYIRTLVEPDSLV